MLQGLDDDKIKSAAIDIFSYIVEFNPSMVREFIVQETQTQDDVRLSYFCVCVCVFVDLPTSQYLTVLVQKLASNTDVRPYFSKYGHSFQKVRKSGRE